MRCESACARTGRLTRCEWQNCHDSAIECAGLCGGVWLVICVPLENYQEHISSMQVHVAACAVLMRF
jgi:hypothetical protein